MEDTTGRPVTMRSNDGPTAEAATGVSTLSRRRILKVAGAGLAAGALATRGPSPSWAKNVAVQGEPIELTYWHGWTEQWEEMVQFVVDQFHASQSRIRIKPQVVTWTDTGADFLAKLTASIAAGDPPDVVTLFGSSAIPALASQGGIVPLDGIEGADLPGVQAWMDPNIYRLGQYQDQTYGLSYWAGTYAVIYNKGHALEAGLDPEVGPATIAELDAMAERLTVVDAGGAIQRMGFLPGDLWLWGTVFGGTFYDPEANKVTANDPNIVRALEWIQSYPEKYGAGPIASFNEGLASERAANLDPLIAGKYAMMAQGPWKLGDIKKFADPSFQYGVVRPPLATPESPPANWTWGDIQVIPEGAKDPSASAEFIRFTAGVNDPEGYATRCTWGGRPINIPVSRSVLEVPAFQQVVNDYPGFQTFIDALLSGQRVGSPPVMPAAAFYSDRMAAMLDRVMLLQEEPQPALDGLTEEVQRELERM
jgi:multiple sugar transport system substrate-binding protein